MYIIVISERFGGMSNKANCYKVDTAKFNDILYNIRNSCKGASNLVKTLEMDTNINLMLLNENYNTVVVVSDVVKNIDVGTEFDTIYNTILNMYTQYVTISKACWHKQAEESLWVPFEEDKDYICVIRGIYKYKASPFKKYKKLMIKKSDLSKRCIEDKSLTNFMILALLKTSKAIILWDRELVMGIVDKQGKVTPIELKEDAYKNLRGTLGVTWKFDKTADELETSYKDFESDFESDFKKDSKKDKKHKKEK